MTAYSSLPSKRFVSTEWLAEHLGDPNVAIVDGSFYLPALKRDASAEYLAAHIPGAVQFDIDAIADHSTNLPHMLPSADAFAAAVGKLGIHDGMTIVVYDGAGLGGAPRVWWTFRVFGAENVLVLDGGLPRWRAEGRAVQSGTPAPKPRRFTARLRRSLVRDLAGMRQNLTTRKAQVLDARSRAPSSRARAWRPSACSELGLYAQTLAAACIASAASGRIGVVAA